MWKSISWITLLLAASFILSSAQQPSNAAGIPSRPQEEGAYYYAGTRSWERLSHILNAGRKPRHVYRIIVPSLVPGIVLIFRESEAPVKIAARKPVFFIRSSGVAGKLPGVLDRDVLIVRLAKRKDHRELPVTTGASIFNVSQSIPKTQIVKSVVTVESENAFTVTPIDDLAPGEYIITFGTGQLGGYDFEIKRNTGSP
jgi:hypothetical protein